MKKLEAVIGEKFNMLTVVSLVYKREGSRRYFVDCQCECGNTKSIDFQHVRRGNQKSCGCIRVKLAKNLKKSHGRCGSPSYTTWTLMKQRCDNPENPSYPNYGGRGITYDPKWETFEGFYEDMGDRPEGLTLERVDTNGDYCKQNCVWDNRTTQAHNQRKKTELGGKLTSSKFRGVSWSKTRGVWISKLTFNGKVILLQAFKTEREAAEAYDAMSFKVYGDKPNEKLL